MASAIPTLPAHVYAEYTQRGGVSGDPGAWLGIVVAILGIVLAGAVVALRSRRQS